MATSRFFCKPRKARFNHCAMILCCPFLNPAPHCQFLAGYMKDVSPGCATQDTNRVCRIDFLESVKDLLYEQSTEAWEDAPSAGGAAVDRGVERG